MISIDDRTEWLEADGLGGFASGTTSGVRTRRYHALLLTATTPPTGRVVLVNGFDAWIETPSGSFALSTQRYQPDVLYPDGASHIIGFGTEPWPTWEFEISDGTRIVQEILVEHGTGRAIARWTLTAGTGPVRLRVRPFLSGRDYHALHRENGAFRFDPRMLPAAVELRPYDGLPAVTMSFDGEYTHAPEWYRNFLYTAERERGLDDTEDLASPGIVSWSMTPSVPVVLLLGAGDQTIAPSRDEVSAEAGAIVERERRRRARFVTALDRAADTYIVRRGGGRTIAAGYPWFTDWGRDTFIAVRGLCLATGRTDVAREILVQWADAVSEGMLPNRFPDRGETPEFNSVDASLWYVVAVGELLLQTRTQPHALDRKARRTLEDAVLRIVGGYASGTRYGIRMDADGLLRAGEPGVQLTWMDARVGDRVITPRIGKPVEIQALWQNALAVASRVDRRWHDVMEHGRRSFLDRFWIEETGLLADVVDVDHVAGTRDETLRPNQILAVGGLPLALVEGARADRIVRALEDCLVTPMGLRSLAPGEPGYAVRYEGSPSARDAVYHQGTVWPWLLGPFVDAWVRVRGNSAAARAEARSRFVEPVRAHLATAGLGHVSEIADATPPFTPRGCPFQAWSLGELLRIERQVIADVATESAVAGALTGSSS